MLLPPISPGEILRTEFLEPLNTTCQQFAGDLDLSFKELEDFLAGKTPVTRYLADKLSVGTGTSAQFWINLQLNYEEDLQRREASRNVS